MSTIFPGSASVGQIFDGYSFDGTAWNIIGNEFNPTSFSPTAPDNPKAGDLWVDSSTDVESLSPENILTTNTASATYLSHSAASSTYLTLASASADYATKSYTDNAVSALVDSSPSTLNTLNELAAALNDDANFSSTVATSLGNKLDISSASTTYATKSSPTFTGTVTSPNINVTTGYQKNGTTLSSITYADILVSAQAGENTYLLNLPAGVDADNFVSITPKNGVNNYLMVTGVALGAWSGVQTLNQIRVRCFLGNGVHLDPFILRVYYRV